MREKSGRMGRLSTKVKAAFVALIAVFAVGAVTATSASAADQLDFEFNDAWIKVDALAPLTGGGMQALDPTDADSPKIKIKSDLKPDGKFDGKPADFSFPDTLLPVNSFGIKDITLSISTASDFDGTYDRATGAATANLPLSLTVLGTALPSGAELLKCQISPMNIALSTAGTAIDFGSEEEPQLLAPSAFTNGQGALLGSWTGVTLQDIKGLPTAEKTAEEMTEGCHILIGGLIGGEDAEFDGSIWLKGTSKITEIQDPICPLGTTGTPPDCKPSEALKANFSKVVVTPKKGKIKKGKSLKIKVKVTNSGTAAGKATIALKSSNKQVKVPKKVTVNVAAGKTVTKTITVKATKKAKGKANITAKVGKKSAKATFTVKK